MFRRRKIQNNFQSDLLIGKLLAKARTNNNSQPIDLRALMSKLSTSTVQQSKSSSVHQKNMLNKLGIMLKK